MTEDLGPARTFLAYLNAVLASDLTPSQRLVLIVQAKHADAHDDELTNSYPSEDTLARETGLSTKTIERTRKALVELGWLIQTHSGRGGSSKWSNAYDLAVPGEASSNRHGVALQTDMVSRQTDMVSRANRHSVGTSTPSSTPISTPAPTAEKGRRRIPIKKDGKDGPVSYWVGYSKRFPDGYFIRADGSTEPKGAHVLVTISREKNMNLWACFGREEILGFILELARDLGLRPPSPAGRIGARPSLVSAAQVDPEPRILTRAERDEMYGPSPWEVQVHRPSAPPRHAGLELYERLASGR